MYPRYRVLPPRRQPGANLVCAYGLLTAFDTRFDGVVHRYQMSHIGQCPIADEDFSPTCLGLEALGDVDHITYYRILHALFRANVPDDCLATVDTDTDMQRWFTATATAFVQAHDRVLNIQGGLDGATVVIGLG